MKSVSIVVPVFDEAETVQAFYQEIYPYLKSEPYKFELIFVDDGSKDNTLSILEQISHDDDRVKVIALARNFGHQIALTCGLDYAEGDAVITMDGDLQHPPQLLPLLLSKWEEGFEVVQTIRRETRGVSLFKRISSRSFYRLINAMSSVSIIEGGSDFRLMDRNVLLTFRRFREKARFIRGIIGNIGYRQVQIEFVAPPRYAGSSKFSLKKMMAFALDGITAYSRLPLRFALYMGILMSLLSFTLTIDVIYTKFFTPDSVPGWATIAASVLFLGGLQLAGLGIIGEYIGRIFEEVKERPLYWIRSEAEHVGNTVKTTTKPRQV